jgi:hypothetical protein
MAATAQTQPRATFFPTLLDARGRHRLLVAVAVVALIAIVAVLSVYGFDYYSLAWAHRARSPKHAVLRSSGHLGVRVGMLSAAVFGCLYAYAFRKKWAWLSRIGKTKNWLDFHVLAGIAAPLLVSFHAAFKFQGLVGVAYWIMIAVMLSGFVGRYFYTQIPRSLNAAELSLKEIAAMKEELASSLARQRIFSPERLQFVYRIPERTEVQSMPLWRVLFKMLSLDLARPLLVAALRREALTPMGCVLLLGGLVPSRNAAVESVVELARKQAWLMVKIAFLDRVHEVFDLWHVVHRPFSYSLAVLLLLHIAVVFLLGYY